MCIYCNNGSALPTSKMSWLNVHETCVVQADEESLEIVEGSIRELVVNHGKRILRAKTSSGTTPLHLAAIGTSDWLLKVLIANGADVNARNENGETALHWSSYAGNMETVIALLNAGAKITLDDHGDSPLSWAIEGEQMGVAKLLLPHCRNILYESNEDGETPISMAIQTNHFEDIFADDILNNFR